ncbi:hypothetical protein P7C70_g7325, partial [Phenoliferia sp. Uapishka_3]
MRSPHRPVLSPSRRRRTSARPPSHPPVRTNPFSARLASTRRINSSDHEEYTVPDSEAEADADSRSSPIPLTPARMLPANMRRPPTSSSGQCERTSSVHSPRALAYPPYLQLESPYRTQSLGRPS